MPALRTRPLVFSTAAVHDDAMLIQFPGSSSLPPAIARALADEQLPASLRDALRTATGDDEEDRLLALDALQTGMTLAEDVEDDDGTAPPGLRLFPAVVALAGLREGPERLALLGISGGLEMMRLAGELDIPEDLGDDWDAAHADALRMCAAELSSPADPEVVRPLLACMATLQGDVMLGGAIASFDDEGGDDGDDSDLEADEDNGDDDA
jgi:hypothetical protein